MPNGIPVPIVLRSGSERADLFAYIDTGASDCLFARGQGELLGLNIESGEPKTFRTASGRIQAFGHISAYDFE